MGLFNRKKKNVKKLVKAPITGKARRFGVFGSKISGYAEVEVPEIPDDLLNQVEQNKNDIADLKPKVEQNKENVEKLVKYNQFVKVATGNFSPLQESTVPPQKFLFIARSDKLDLNNVSFENCELMIVVRREKQPAPGVSYRYDDLVFKIFSIGKDFDNFKHQRAVFGEFEHLWYASITKTTGLNIECFNMGTTDFKTDKFTTFDIYRRDLWV